MQQQIKSDWIKLCQFLRTTCIHLLRTNLYFKLNPLNTPSQEKCKWHGNMVERILFYSFFMLSTSKFMCKQKLSIRLSVFFLVADSVEKNISLNQNTFSSWKNNYWTKMKREEKRLHTFHCVAPCILLSLETISCRPTISTTETSKGKEWLKLGSVNKSM